MGSTLKKGAIVGILCLICCFCSCTSADVQECVSLCNNVIENLGALVLTPDENLIGIREKRDGYCGSYRVNCEEKSGKEIVFGGTSLEKRERILSGTVQSSKGEVRIILQKGPQTIQIFPDESGSIYREVTSFSSFYIRLEYEDFSGTVELSLE